MEAKDYLARLNEILVGKQAMLAEILGFTRMQREALQAERYDDLEVLIARKQERIEAVDKLDEQFAVYSARLKAALGIESFDELPQHGIPGTPELKENVARIMSLLEEIKAIDDENTVRMKDGIAELKGAIQRNNSFKLANKAYNSPKSVVSNYFDKKK
jgi:hypothetical protein